VLPESWHASTPDHYSFRYAHSQSSLTFILKITKLGTKTIILAIAEGDDKTASFDITTDDYTSPSFFQSTSFDAADIQHGYITKTRVQDLASLLKINVLQKLIPGLSKAGYVETTESNTQPRTFLPSTTTQQESSREEPSPYNDPAYGRPRPINPGPFVPDFDDEHGYLSMPRPGLGGGRSPFSIGHDDLNPPGLYSNPHDFGPFFGGSGSSGSILPRPGGGGMHPTADHPIFGGRGGQSQPPFDG
jgi:hypothetical protein